ncbi:hypothetical protein ACH414_33200 [Streptomyces sp. NPDC020422]|uniref:hypothetical protein n=1 Tax=Streptomyces sp. NPDC020422 TaxID=3365074 RepID=UPI0037B9B7E2
MMLALDHLIALAENRASHAGDSPSVDGARRHMWAVRTSLLSDVIPLNHDEAARLADELCRHLGHALDAVAQLAAADDVPPPQAALERWQQHYDVIVDHFTRLSRVTGRLVF